MRYTLSLIFSILVTSMCAQTQVREYQPGVTTDGVTYFLPRTAFHVTLYATKTTYIPGEYYKYAQRYLKLKNVTTETYDVWTLDKIELTPYGIADTSKVYTIKLNTKTSAPLVTLTDDGRLLAINKSVEQPLQLSKPSVTKDNSPVLNASNFMTEEILSAGSSMKVAELLAEEIMDIRENRSLLAKGQADFMPKDGEQLKLMLESLDTQEKSLMQAFKGTEERTKHVYTLDFLPDSLVKNHLLFRFSKYKGLVEVDDLSGEPYYIHVDEAGQLFNSKAPAEKKKKEILDLRFILPAKVLVSITHNGSKVASLSTPFAQLGRVEHLGGDLFNKKFTTKVTLSPITGGILNIEGEPKQK